MDDDIPPSARPDSLLPYEAWAEEALRGVAIRALQYAATEGMPGDHHFYVSFRTDHLGVSIPTRLLAQYPEEMTIVLQHQFWDLNVDEAAGIFSVGLSFGGIASILTVPFAALTAFADPHVQFGLRFRPVPLDAANAEPPPEPDAPEPEEEAPTQTDEAPQVVSLDAFRKRKD
ncbi:MAG: ClpXP protease specificity-enhancing factor SspB [Acetobacteraceae bacterium]